MKTGKSSFLSSRLFIVIIRILINYICIFVRAETFYYYCNLDS